MQVCNPSDRSTTVLPKTVVGIISPDTAISENTASAVANNRLENSRARIDLAAALDESFKKSTFNDHQQTQLLDRCTMYRSVFSSSPKELSKGTIAEAKFPLQKQAKPVDHHPYRTNPRAQEVIDKSVESMESDGTIDKSPSAWGSPMCVVAKADGSLRLYVSCRNTSNKFLVRETWPMPDIESHIDTLTVGGAKFITVCDVQSAYWQIPTANKDCHKTAFVTSKGKYTLKALPSGIANTPCVFQRVMPLAIGNFGQRGDFSVYMNDVIACSATREPHLRL